MTKRDLYGVYEDLCKDTGKSPIGFKAFLTLSIAAKRSDAEDVFMRFVAVYGSAAGRKLINEVKG